MHRAILRRGSKPFLCALWGCFPFSLRCTKLAASEELLLLVVCWGLVFWLCLWQGWWYDLIYDPAYVTEACNCHDHLCHL